jgi:hypothetical protein
MFTHSGQQTVILTTTGGGKFCERVIMNKQMSNRFHIERFNFKKLNKVGGKEQTA